MAANASPVLSVIAARSARSEHLVFFASIKVLTLCGGMGERPALRPSAAGLGVMKERYLELNSRWLLEND
jgi:hypothetical protein